MLEAVCVELCSWGICLYSSEGAVLKKLQRLRLWGFACRSQRLKPRRLEPSLITVPLGAAVRGRRPCRGAAPPVPPVTLSPPRGRQRAVRAAPLPPRSGPAGAPQARPAPPPLPPQPPPGPVRRPRRGQARGRWEGTAAGEPRGRSLTGRRRGG